MRFTSAVGMMVSLAGAAVLVYAERRAEKTGRDVGAVLSNLPEELKDTRQELKKSLKKAMEAGKLAATEKEAEIDRQLEAAEAQAPDSGPPVQEFLI